MRGFLSEEQRRCCGTCKWHRLGDTEVEKYENEWLCMNQKTRYYTFCTDYNDICDDWEARDGK